MIHLPDKRIAVTGGDGFLGHHVVQALRNRGCSHITVPLIAQYDLSREASLERFYAEAQPEIVIHLAAEVGGIGANRAYPGRFVYANLVMGALLIEHARLAGVEKFVQIGTICAYPKFTPVPFREEALWNGYPKETNAPYGLAKRLAVNPYDSGFDFLEFSDNFGDRERDEVDHLRNSGGSRLDFRAQQKECSAQEYLRSPQIKN